MAEKTQEKEPFEFDIEEVVTAIDGIAKAMKKLNSSRLKREAIVTLIHSHSKVSKKTIEIVLNNLEAMDRIWLKNQSS